MKDKKIYFLLLLPLVVFLGLIIFLVISNYFKPKNVTLEPVITNKEETNVLAIPPTSNNQQNTNEKIDGGKVLESAKSNKDPKECFKIADKKYVLACLQLLAQSLQDEKICSSIENPLDSAKCLDEVIMKKAINQNNIDLCSKIDNSSLKNSCIINSIEKNTLNPDSCQKLPDEEKTFCVNYFSFVSDSAIFKSAKSVEECQKIIGEPSKTFCLEKFSQ